jgi:hypothetical protein
MLSSSNARWFPRRAEIPTAQSLDWITLSDRLLAQERQRAQANAKFDIHQYF